MGLLFPCVSTMANRAFDLQACVRGTPSTESASLWIHGPGPASVTRSRLSVAVATVGWPIGWPRSRRLRAIDELRVFRRQVHQHRRQRRVVLEVIKHNLVVRIAVRVPGVTPVVPVE